MISATASSMLHIDLDPEVPEATTSTTTTTSAQSSTTSAQSDPDLEPEAFSAAVIGSIDEVDFVTDQCSTRWRMVCRALNALRATFENVGFVNRAIGGLPVNDAINCALVTIDDVFEECAGQDHFVYEDILQQLHDGRLLVSQEHEAVDEPIKQAIDALFKHAVDGVQDIRSRYPRISDDYLRRVRHVTIRKSTFSDLQWEEEEFMPVVRDIFTFLHGADYAILYAFGDTTVELNGIAISSERGYILPAKLEDMLRPEHRTAATALREAYANWDLNRCAGRFGYTDIKPIEHIVTSNRIIAARGLYHAFYRLYDMLAGAN